METLYENESNQLDLELHLLGSNVINNLMYHYWYIWRQTIWRVPSALCFCTVFPSSLYLFQSLSFPHSTCSYAYRIITKAIKLPHEIERKYMT